MKGRMSPILTLELEDRSLQSILQVALLSQRGRAMLRVCQYSVVSFSTKRRAESFIVSYGG